jgi:pyruvate carboxylase
VFKMGSVWTSFIDDTPSLFQKKKKRSTAYNMLTYLGHIIVNGSMIMGQHVIGLIIFLNVVT